MNRGPIARTCTPCHPGGKPPGAFHLDKPEDGEYHWGVNDHGN